MLALPIFQVAGYQRLLRSLISSHDQFIVMLGVQNKSGTQASASVPVVQQTGVDHPDHTILRIHRKVLRMVPKETALAAHDYNRIVAIWPGIGVEPFQCSAGQVLWFDILNIPFNRSLESSITRVNGAVSWQMSTVGEAELRNQRHFNSCPKMPML